MADDKKSGPPKAPAPAGWKAIDVVIVLIVLASLLGALAAGLSNLLSQSGGPTFFGIPLSSFKDFFLGNSLLFKFISFFISAICIIGIVSLSLLKGEILKAERAKLFPAGDPFTVSSVPPEADDDTKKAWRRIVAYSESDVESNWRIAIIEADTILDDLLWKLGLNGETMGDRLKAVERSDFLTIDDAWEAHKIRNLIAHEGSGFQLNQRETRRVISLYEKVFKEFYLI